jgi:hypothetical protein
MRAGHRLGDAKASRAATVGRMVDNPPFALDQLVEQALDRLVGIVHDVLPAA